MDRKTRGAIRMKKVYIYEPWFFIFFGTFHLHRIWGIIDRTSYSSFWINVMDQKGLIYFMLMGILALLCILGMITFFKNMKHNYWWRYIYLFGGGYVLFDLFAIAVDLKFWHKLIITMFDVNAVYWNYVWGGFILIGALSFALGCGLLRMRIAPKDV